MNFSGTFRITNDHVGDAAEKHLHRRQRREGAFTVMPSFFVLDYVKVTKPGTKVEQILDTMVTTDTHQ